MRRIHYFKNRRCMLAICTEIKPSLKDDIRFFAYSNESGTHIEPANYDASGRQDRTWHDAVFCRRGDPDKRIHLRRDSSL